MSGVIQDLAYALRQLGKNRGFTIVAVVTLALGIGANTAIFSVVDAARIRPLPYWQANRLITLSEVRPQEGKSGETDTRTWDASYPDYLDWTRQSKSFQSLAGFSGDQSVSASPCFQAWGKRTDSTKRSISLDRSLWYQNCCDTRVQVEQQRCLQQQIPLCLVSEISS